MVYVVYGIWIGYGHMALCPVNIQNPGCRVSRVNSFSQIISQIQYGNSVIQKEQIGQNIDSN